jgi:hypothetical protein
VSKWGTELLFGSTRKSRKHLRQESSIASGWMLSLAPSATSSIRSSCDTSTVEGSARSCATVFIYLSTLCACQNCGQDPCAPAGGLLNRANVDKLLQQASPFNHWLENAPLDVFLFIIFLACLKSRLRSPCQHLGKWRNAGTKSQRRRDSFSSKALLSMEIAALAARTSECLMPNLETERVRSSLRRELRPLSRAEDPRIIRNLISLGLL